MVATRRSLVYCFIARRTASEGASGRVERGIRMGELIVVFLVGFGLVVLIIFQIYRVSTFGVPCRLGSNTIWITATDIAHVFPPPIAPSAWMVRVYQLMHIILAVGGLGAVIGVMTVMVTYRRMIADQQQIEQRLEA
jgi:hypothetical protein